MRGTENAAAGNPVAAPSYAIDVRSAEETPQLRERQQERAGLAAAEAFDGLLPALREIKHEVPRAAAAGRAQRAAEQEQDQQEKPVGRLSLAVVHQAGSRLEHGHDNHGHAENHHGQAAPALHLLGQIRHEGLEVPVEGQHGQLHHRLLENHNARNLLSVRLPGSVSAGRFPERGPWPGRMDRPDRGPVPYIRIIPPEAGFVKYANRSRRDHFASYTRRNEHPSLAGPQRICFAYYKGVCFLLHGHSTYAFLAGSEAIH